MADDDAGWEVVRNPKKERLEAEKAARKKERDLADRKTAAERSAVAATRAKEATLEYQLMTQESAFERLQEKKKTEQRAKERQKLAAKAAMNDGAAKNNGGGGGGSPADVLATLSLGTTVRDAIDKYVALAPRAPERQLAMVASALDLACKNVAARSLAVDIPLVWLPTSAATKKKGGASSSSSSSSSLLSACDRLSTWFSSLPGERVAAFVRNDALLGDLLARPHSTGTRLFAQLLVRAHPLVALSQLRKAPSLKAHRHAGTGRLAAEHVPVVVWLFSQVLAATDASPGRRATRAASWALFVQFVAPHLCNTELSAPACDAIAAYTNALLDTAATSATTVASGDVDAARVHSTFGGAPSVDGGVAMDAALAAASFEGVVLALHHKRLDSMRQRATLERLRTVWTELTVFVNSPAATAAAASTASSWLGGLGTPAHACVDDDFDTADERAGAALVSLAVDGCALPRSFFLCALRHAASENEQLRDHCVAIAVRCIAEDADAVARVWLAQYAQAVAASNNVLLAVASVLSSENAANAPSFGVSAVLRRTAAPATARCAARFVKTNDELLAGTSLSSSRRAELNVASATCALFDRHASRLIAASSSSSSMLGGRGRGGAGGPASSLRSVARTLLLLLATLVLFVLCLHNRTQLLHVARCDDDGARSPPAHCAPLRRVLDAAVRFDHEHGVSAEVTKHVALALDKLRGD